MKIRSAFLTAFFASLSLPSLAAVQNVPFGSDSEFLRRLINQVRVEFKEQGVTLNSAPTHLSTLQCRTSNPVPSGQGLPKNDLGTFRCAAVTDFRRVADPAFNEMNTLRVVRILVAQAHVSFKRDSQNYLITPLLYVSCRNFKTASDSTGCTVEVNRLKH